jgi:hypothetical protein
MDTSTGGLLIPQGIDTSTGGLLISQGIDTPTGGLLRPRASIPLLSIPWRANNPPVEVSISWGLIIHQ